MYLFFVTNIIHTTRSVIVLHVSVLCDKIYPYYSQCYSITCISSLWQKLSSLLAVLYIVVHVSVLCDTNCPYYWQCYCITCICSMWHKIVLATFSIIVLHISVLCDNNCPRPSQCYSITCICSMWQKLSSLLAVL